MVQYFKYDKTKKDILSDAIQLLLSLPFFCFCFYTLYKIVTGHVRSYVFAFQGILLFGFVPFVTIHYYLLRRRLLKIDEHKILKVDFQKQTLDIDDKYRREIHLTSDDVLNIEIWRCYWEGGRFQLLSAPSKFYKINLFNDSPIILTSLIIDEETLLDVLGREKVCRKVFYWYSMKKELQLTAGLLP